MEQEKRMRREIANSNERRRMQSINAGFQTLKTLLHHDGEKLSKAAILQQTADYIYQIEQEKTRLLAQNCQLKRLLNQQNHDSDGGSSIDSPLPKRKKSDAASEPVDEGIGSMSPPSFDESGMDALKREMIELRVQLDRERRLRMLLEEQTRNLENRLYPERVRELSSQAQRHQYNHRTTEKEIVENGEIHSPRREVPEIRVPVVTSMSDNDVDDDVDNDDDDSMAEDMTMVHSPIHVNVAAPPSIPPPPPSSTIPESPKVLEQPPPSSRGYVASTSRQNLETIVEAIRHLEGDHLFRDDNDTSSSLVIRSHHNHHPKSPSSSSSQQVITTKPTTESSSKPSSSSTNNTTTTTLHSVLTTVNKLTARASPHGQNVIKVSRPGVIVSTHS